MPAMHNTAVAATGALWRAAAASAIAPNPHGEASAANAAAPSTATVEWDCAAAICGSSTNAPPASSANGTSAWSSDATVGAQAVQPARLRKMCDMAKAALQRAAATSGPNVSIVAAATGSDSAPGPPLQPQPSSAAARGPSAGATRAASAPARINGMLSNRVLALVATIACSAGLGTIAASAIVHTTKKAFMSKFTAPRGTQDFIPPQTERWQELEARARHIAGSFGYGEIRTPMFESTELFVHGVGEATDIVEKEMYTFVDKGGRSMTLRPEWTAPVVRAAMEHNLFSAGAQRLYYIGPIFRYERPQKGRYRQSHQFGIECFGFKGPQADFEVIQLAWELIARYDLRGTSIHINSVGDAVCRPRYREALLEHFRPHLPELSGDSQKRLERNPLRLLDSKSPQDQPFVLSAPSFESVLCDGCREHFEGLKTYLVAANIPFVVDPRIVRGLDYYTRTVFEIVSDALGSQSTVCGGGRYDGLVASLGGPPTPAVGFGLGLERFLLMLEAAGTAGEAQRSGVQFIALGAQAKERLVLLLAALRAAGGGPSFMDYDDRKLVAQLKIADRNGARYAVLAGTDELASGKLVLRDLVSRQDRHIPFVSEKDTVTALVEGSR